ncbi:hypothetical protein FALBO_16215 [Fusarium albosuccineum]|uniref:Protein kinase domain-containing protein n=1 Tax=Fusarium albosuccineum TaxID=1237068 RepID=A0A8H4KMA4_9HYPO|nr:hypothetical protein FALBO_16215 [Fusarium albosuccineum]
MEGSDGYTSTSENGKDPYLPRPPRLRTIYFRFGSRIIGATGRASDHSHPNVLRLQIHSTICSQIIQGLVSLLPTRFTSWIQGHYPEWCLPARIVFKIQKDDWEREFNRERAAYVKLEPVQGVTTPMYYGCIDYDGKRASILSDIGGACVATPEGAVLEPDDLRVLSDQALTALTKLGVSHDDIKLDNFHLVTENGKDRIMVVDFEMIDTDLSAEDFAYAAESSGSWLIQQYRQHLNCLEHDGLLLPKRPLNA